METDTIIEQGEWRVDGFEINDGRRSIVRAPHPNEFFSLPRAQRESIAAASKANLEQIVADHNNAADYQASLTRLTAQRNRYWEQVEVLREALKKIRAVCQDESVIAGVINDALAAVAGESES